MTLAPPELTAPRRRWIGARLRRKEDPRFITGHGAYLDDLQLPGMLYAAILRSPYAHARIRRIDTRRVRALPGVVAVLTGRELAELVDPVEAYIVPQIKEYPLAIDRVRHVGEGVAAVAATSRGLAEDVLEQIEVEYEPLPVVIDAEETMRPEAPKLFDELESNVIWHGRFEYGDVDGAFRQAAHVFRASFRIHRYFSTAIETNGVIADYDPGTGQYTVWSNLAMPGRFFDTMCKALRVRGDQLRLITPDIGGSYGNKWVPHRYLVFILCALARACRRPVKYVEDRIENLRAAQSCESRLHVEAAVAPNGEFLGLRIKDIENEGAKLAYAVYHITNKLSNLVGCYRTKNILLEGYSVTTNTCPAGPNRGIGKPGMCLIWERLMDVAARGLHLDPAEIRRRNFIRPEEFPYTTPSGNLYESGEYARALQEGLEAIDYTGWRRRQRQLRRRGRYVGIGLSVSVEPGGTNMARHYIILDQPRKSGAAEAATVRVDVTGKVFVALSQPNAGQGHETTAAQIVADVLAIHPDDVTVANTFDTCVSPWTGYSGLGGNDYSPVAVPAILGAAQKVRAKLLRVAAHLLQAPTEQLELHDGHAVVQGDPTRRLALREIANVVYAKPLTLPADIEPGIQETYFYNSPLADLPDAQKRVKSQLSFGYGAHAAVVEVDARTGQTRILRYVVVGDYGTLINPAIVEGQVHGNATHAIATTLGEGFVYDRDGQLLTSTFMDYFKPTAADTPPVEVRHFEIANPFNPIGVKAVGEGAAILAPAAIMNAVEDALQPLGVEIRNLPLTPEAVWTLLEEARAGRNNTGGPRSRRSVTAS